MSFPDATSLTQDILDALGDDGVTFYPVRAAEVAAYLAGGNSGVDLSGLGVVAFQTIEYDDGEVGVDTERATFTTDEDTVADNGIARNTSIRFQGVLYDIFRIRPDHPGGTDCYLRKHSG